MIYDDPMMYPLTSYATFNDLLNYTTTNRYCLKVHVKTLNGVPTSPTLACWGIKTGTGPISTYDTGIFWYHYFSTTGTPSATLSCYSYKNGVSTGTSTYTLTNLANPVIDVWYTMYFDPNSVTIYASPTGYTSNSMLKLGTFAHGIDNITANGPVYLKLASGSHKVDEIYLYKGNTGAVTNVKGRVTLNDFTGPKFAKPVDIELRPPGQTVPDETHCPYLNGSGDYVLDTPLKGVYDITAKASTWLRKKVSDINTTTDNTSLNFSLVNGDCDGDNEVTSFDLSIVLAAMDAASSDPNWNPLADLNGDTVITTADLSIVLTSMDLLGD
jgi:hypothetical protein